MRKVLIWAVLLVVLGATSGPGRASAGGRPLTSTLSGPAVVPGPGDPDGWGKATLRLNHGQRTLCYTLTVGKIAPSHITSIHVIANADGTGPEVLSLNPPTYGSSEGCLTGVDRSLIKAMMKNPENYYINVINARFKNGAVRGSLSK